MIGKLDFKPAMYEFSKELDMHTVVSMAKPK